MNRRHFLASALASPLAASETPQRPVLCIFSKHMAKLSLEQLGKTAKQMGFDGVDLTVRPGGHVLPERAVTELPRAAEIIRAGGLQLPMISTAITSSADPVARPLLTAAGKLNISCWKAGYVRYDFDHFDRSIRQTREMAADLASLSGDCGIACGIHNHSGNNIGTALWDTFRAIEYLDPKWIGFYFDPGHATIEGGLAGWRLSQALVMPRLKMVAVKDFYWVKEDGKWEPRWCPLGEGMVNWAEVFKVFAAARYSGPVSLHLEYEAPDEMAAIAKDLDYLKKLVAKSYGD